MTRLRAAAALGAMAVLAAASVPATAATWEPVPLPPPPGGAFSTPAGYPGDISFWRPNRGLMTVAGNTSVPAGVYSWDGRSWHQLATVCGGSGGARIAWAGPTEFWTIASPSPGVAAANALCRFKDGAVAGSFAGTNVPGYDHEVFAAACRDAADCWFAGSGERSRDGVQEGAFHLRWNGSELTPVYGPQGRAVSDLQAHAGRTLESVYAGPTPSARSAPVLREPEPVPALLHSIDGGSFANDPWSPRPLADLPADGTELRALDSDGTTAFAVGGGANSGASAVNGPLRRTPSVARLDGRAWTELDLHGAPLRTDETFGDVAVLPGTRSAWATLVDSSMSPYALSTASQPRVAHIAADGAVSVLDLAGPADPLRGAAARIDCPTADDCWLATARGYVYRWGGPKDYPVDDDPAFQGTITERPNEGAAQFLPDTPPDDDSRLFAPPVELPLEPEQPPAACRRPPRLMSGVRAPRRTPAPGSRRGARDPRFVLTVGFRLARRANVALVAERRSTPRGRRGQAGAGRPRRPVTRVVARTRLRTLAAGRRTLAVVVRRTAWPTRLRFVLREATRPRCQAAAAASGTDSPR